MTAISSGPDGGRLQSEIDRRRGRFVPWIIAAFYMTFMTTLIGFVVIAYRHPPSEVTAEAYEKGLAYNQTLEKASLEEALGWHSTVSYERGVIRFELRDSRRRPIDGATVKAWFVHPANAGDDRSLVLLPAGEGVYKAALRLPSPGLWTVHVTAAKQGRQYQSATPLEVP